MKAEFKWLASSITIEYWKENRQIPFGEEMSKLRIRLLRIFAEEYSILLKDDTELSEKEIRNIHSLITKGIENINPGQYRTVPVYISGAEHIPPQPYIIFPEMEKLMLWYRNEANELHPIERATILHGEFVKIHPFLDGNGRTSRLLLNFELMKNGYPPIIIEKSERAIYFESLEKGSLTGDWTDFIQFVAKKCEERIDFINSFKEKETK